jgi:hypothetical protein
MISNSAGVGKFFAHLTFKVFGATGLFLWRTILHAPNPKGKSPGAGRRVNVERRGLKGEQYIDAATGDIQLRLD